MVQTRSMGRRTRSQVKDYQLKLKTVVIPRTKLPKKIKTRKITLPKVSKIAPKAINEEMTVNSLDDTLLMMENLNHHVRRKEHDKQLDDVVGSDMSFEFEKCKPRRLTVPKVNKITIDEEMAVNALNDTLVIMEDVNRLDETEEHITQINDNIRSDLSFDFAKCIPSINRTPNKYSRPTPTNNHYESPTSERVRVRLDISQNLSPRNLSKNLSRYATSHDCTDSSNGENVKQMDETMRSDMSFEFEKSKPCVKRMKVNHTKYSSPTPQQNKSVGNLSDMNKMMTSALQFPSLDESSESSDDDSFEDTYEQMRTRFTK